MGDDQNDPEGETSKISPVVGAAGAVLEEGQEQNCPFVSEMWKTRSLTLRWKKRCEIEAGEKI